MLYESPQKRCLRCLFKHLRVGNCNLYFLLQFVNLFYPKKLKTSCYVLSRLTRQQEMGRNPVFMCCIKIDTFSQIRWRAIQKRPRTVKPQREKVGSSTSRCQSVIVICQSTGQPLTSLSQCHVTLVCTNSKLFLTTRISITEISTFKSSNGILLLKNHKIHTHQVHKPSSENNISRLVMQPLIWIQLSL